MKTRDLVAVAMMTALLALLGALSGIPLGFIPVPLVLQNLGVMLAGLLLGGKKGTLAVLLLLLLGLVVPVFSGLTTTIKVLAGPTAGYVLAWLAVPFLMARVRAALAKDKFLGLFLAVWLTGVLFVDLVGGLYLAYYLKAPLYQALVFSNLTFLPGDSLKALLAAALALRLGLKDKSSLF